MARRAEGAAARLAEDVGRAIFRARRLLWSRAAGRLEARGESILAFQMLNQLQRTGPANQGEIALAIGQHPTSVSRLLDELERGGFVRRSRERSDRRRLRVAITPLGGARLAQMRPEVLGAVEEVLHPLGTGERRALAALLEKVIAAGA
jgi:MarR family 2-MHQ and catechol resistance regulon transcriptional repressor